MLSKMVADGSIDLERLKTMTNEEVRSFIMDLKGFGRWSADYILIRGLGFPDALPSDDLGIRRTVGEYLGGGTLLTSKEVEKRLEPFRPYRGIAAYYLLIHQRLLAKSLKFRN